MYTRGSDGGTMQRVVRIKILAIRQGLLCDKIGINMIRNITVADWWGKEKKVYY